MDRRRIRRPPASPFRAAGEVAEEGKERKSKGGKDKGGRRGMGVCACSRAAHQKIDIKKYSSSSSDGWGKRRRRPAGVTIRHGRDDHHDHHRRPVIIIVVLM